MSSIKKVRDKKDFTKALVGALVVLVLLDLTPLGGNIPVYLRWAQCGSRPFQSETWTIEGEVPHYKPAPTFAVLRGMPEYFCSEREAQIKGYSADSSKYSFPQLSDVETRTVLSNYYHVNP